MLEQFITNVNYKYMYNYWSDEVTSLYTLVGQLPSINTSRAILLETTYLFKKIHKFETAILCKI